MTARELIRIQSTRFALATIFWIGLTALSGIVFVALDLSAFAWIPIVLCLVGLFVSSYILQPKCPFCDAQAPMGRADDLGDYCKYCSCSLDEIVTGLNRFKPSPRSKTFKQE